MLEDGLIKHSTSPWASPIVTVKKSSGDMNICVDCRRLNKQMVQLSILQHGRHAGQKAVQEQNEEILYPVDSFSFSECPLDLCTSERVVNHLTKIMKTEDIFTYLDNVFIKHKRHIC